MESLDKTLFIIVYNALTMDIYMSYICLSLYVYIYTYVYEYVYHVFFTFCVSWVSIGILLLAGGFRSPSVQRRSSVGILKITVLGILGLDIID